MDFRDYVDASYDKDFKKIMESHPLTWFPWVGHFYRKARLKVVGGIIGGFLGTKTTETVYDWAFTPLEKEEWEVGCEKK